MNQIKINHTYDILLKLLKNESHGRELSKELKISLTKVQAILANLRKMNILDYKEIGRNHIYFIKKNLISKSFILNAENYKLAKILTKYPFLEPVFQDIIKKSKCNLIILFGSYAKGISKEESDIDIYINTTDLKIKKQIQQAYDLVNVKIGNFNPDELLIKEIMKNHVIIKGTEEYYEKTKFFN